MPVLLNLVELDVQRRARSPQMYQSSSTRGLKVLPPTFSKRCWPRKNEQPSQIVFRLLSHSLVSIKVLTCGKFHTDNTITNPRKASRTFWGAHPGFRCDPQTGLLRSSKMREKRGILANVWSLVTRGLREQERSKIDFLRPHLLKPQAYPRHSLLVAGNSTSQHREPTRSRLKVQDTNELH